MLAKWADVDTIFFYVTEMSFDLQITKCVFDWWLPAHVVTPGDFTANTK